LEADVGELDTTIKAATVLDDDDEPENMLSASEIKQLKSKLGATRKQLKSEKAAFAQRLSAASDALDNQVARAIVLDALKDDVVRESDQRVSRHRREITSAFETWWAKYQVTLEALELQRAEAAVKLTGFLKDLGYE
jgi:type I restriction enzyme M protein